MSYGQTDKNCASLFSEQQFYLTQIFLLYFLNICHNDLQNLFHRVQFREISPRTLSLVREKDLKKSYKK